MFTNIDFANMGVRECVTFIELFTGEVVKKRFHCIPILPLSIGIHFIETDLDYVKFIDIDYKYIKISIYVDHISDGLEGAEMESSKGAYFFKEDLLLKIMTRK